MAESNAAGKRLAKRLGANIAAYRKGRNWTQADLAERVTVDTETISRFERGATLPSLVTLERVGRILRVPLADLIAQSSVQAEDQALVISAWLNELEEADRMYVFDTIKRICQHLRQRR